MTNKNFYKILELDEKQWKGKSGKDWEEALKKNYKNLSRKWHPDRFGNKSEAEKKEAEEKMKEINEAYEILKDPQKRAEYEMPSQNFGGSGFEGFGDFMSGFGDFFHGAETSAVERGRDKTIRLSLSISDIINGCVKKIKYKRYVRCHDCNGIGGKGKTVCPYCHGKGYVREQVQVGPNQYFARQHTCQHCHGQGFKFEHVCDTCHGTGFEEVEDYIEIPFEAGVKQGEAYVAKFKGDESKDPKGSNGDLIAIPCYDFDTTRFNLSHLPDIIQRVKLNWIDAMLGGKMNIELEGRGKRTVTIPECTKPNDHIVLHGLGVPYYENEISFYQGRKSIGNYILEIEYVSPKNLTDEQKELLKKFKETMK